MGLIVFRHGENRDHGDGTFFAHLPSGTLVHRSKVGIKISGITATAGNLLFSSGDFPQCLGIVGDIGENDQHMHSEIKGKIFGSGECHARRGDTLDCRVICQIGEQHGAVNGAGAAELIDKEFGFLIGDADRSKYNCKVAFPVQHPRLTCDLCSELCMRQTGAGEDRQLLSSDQRIQTVNG